MIKKVLASCVERQSVYKAKRTTGIFLVRIARINGTEMTYVMMEDSLPHLEVAHCERTSTAAMVRNA